MALEQLQFLEQQIGQLDQEMAALLNHHQAAVRRLAEVPGLGLDSAQQIIAEVGPTAATFPSEKCLSSLVGACPGDDESAGATGLRRATVTCGGGDCRSTESIDLVDATPDSALTRCKSFTIQVLHCRLEVTQMTRVLSIRRRMSVAEAK